MITIERKEKYEYELPSDIEMEDMYRKIFKDLFKIIKITKPKSESPDLLPSALGYIVQNGQRFVAGATLTEGETEVIYQIESTCVDMHVLFMRDVSNCFAIYMLMCSIIRKEHGDDAVSRANINVNIDDAAFGMSRQQPWGNVRGFTLQDTQWE